MLCHLTTLASVGWPIGTPSERALSQGEIPGHWENSNPYANLYEIAPGVWNYHDGVDLNLNYPHWNDDWHSPIYAMADGMVYFAGVGGGSWGHIICIAHVDPLTGKFYYSRVGHVEAPNVVEGQLVKCGEQIARVGNGDGYYGQSGAHLHFNICRTELMHEKPNQWCGSNKACVLTNYTDPVSFIRERYAMVENPDTSTVMRAALALLPKGTPVTVTPKLPPEREPYGTQVSYVVPVEDVLPAVITPPAERHAKVNGPAGEVRVRKTPGTGEIVVVLPNGTDLIVTDSETANWSKISAGSWAGGYIYTPFLSFQ